MSSGKYPTFRSWPRPARHVAVAAPLPASLPPQHWSNWLSIGIALLALIVTTFNVLVAQSTEQAAIFSQFQQEYSVIAADFPDRLLDTDFKPARGSKDYKRLQDYWIFAYAEWYRTEKNKPIFGTNLWSDYYAGLVLDALNIPSLRYVFEDMFQEGPQRRRDMLGFYDVMRDLAAREGHPLKPPPAPPPGH